MDTSIQRHPLRRPGCVIALVIWFLLLLSPCALIVLASRGEISINTGSAPEQRIRIWMIQEARERGLGVSTADVFVLDEDNICVQTNVSFLLWEGEAEPTQYCECYVKANTVWQTTSLEPTACPAP